MAEVGLQLMHDPSLDETRRIFGAWSTNAATQLLPTFVIMNRLLSCEMTSNVVDYAAPSLRSRR